MVGIFVDKVTESLHVLRVDDIKVKFFEALWEIPEGITYNAYLLHTSEGAILFDSWKHVYTDEFIEALKTVVDLRDIAYVIVHHMEQDHTGSLPRVLEENGFKAEVLCHMLATRMFSRFLGIKPKIHAVKDGEELKVGGKVLKFIYTPWLHWPETMMTFIPGDDVLLSCDAFGGYSIPKTLYDESDNVIAEYLPHVRKYVATVIGHYINYIGKAVEKLDKLGIKPKIIAPAHGLIFRNKPEAIVDYYVKLASGIAEKGKIVVVYSSMYGSVGKAISAVIDKLKEKGFSPVVYRFTDTERINLSDFISDVMDCQALIIGAATYENNVFPLIRHLLDVLVEKIKAGKPVLVVSSYGWGRIAGSKILKILTGAGFKVVDVVEFQGMPDGDDLAKVRSGVDSLIDQIAR